MSEAIEKRLSAAEVAELEGLRAASKKGKLEAGTVVWERFLFLVKKEAGEEVVESRVAWGKEKVMEHYGVKERFYFEMRAMGATMLQEPPWEDPVALGQWFDLAKVRGLRAHGAPKQVKERIDAAVRGVVPASAVVAAPVGRGKGKVAEEAEGQPGLPFVFDGAEANPEQVLSHLRQEVAGLQAAEREFLKEGKLAQAGAVSSKLALARADLHKWEMGAGKMRRGDEEFEADISRKMGQFAVEWWQIVRRAVIAAFPVEQRETVEGCLNAAAGSLPPLLEEHFAMPMEAA